MWQHLPRRTSPDDSVQVIKDLAQIVDPLRGIACYQFQVGRDDGPFLVVESLG